MKEKEKINKEDEFQKEDETAMSETDKLLEIIKEKEEQINDLNDKYLRKAAEFDNFRKRMQKDKADSIKYANQKLLLDIIAVIDNLERAIESGKESKQFDGFFEGVNMITNNLISMLESNYNLKCINCLKEEFDPELHEAIAMEAADTKEQIVLEEFQKGYTFEDRVIRHAKVKVSQPN